MRVTVPGVRVQGDDFVGQTVYVVITPVDRAAGFIRQVFDHLPPVADGIERVVIDQLTVVQRCQPVERVRRELTFQTVWILDRRQVAGGVVGVRERTLRRLLRADAAVRVVRRVPGVAAARHRRSPGH